MASREQKTRSSQRNKGKAEADPDADYHYETEEESEIEVQITSSSRPDDSKKKKGTHEQWANSCVMTDAKNGYERTIDILKRPDCGWGNAMSLETVSKNPFDTSKETEPARNDACPEYKLPGEGNRMRKLVWYDPFDSSHNVENVKLLNARDAMDCKIALSFKQVSHLLDNPGFTLRPYCALDESLAVYATFRYTNRERQTFWPATFMHGGAPRKIRPHFGQPPQCHVLYSNKLQGDTDYAIHKSFLLVFKRQWVMRGNLNTATSNMLSSDKHAWNNDAYQWSFGQESTATNLDPDHLNFRYLIKPDSKLELLPDDLSKKHFSVSPPARQYLEAALAQRRIPFYVGNLKFPIVNPAMSKIPQQMSKTSEIQEQQTRSAIRSGDKELHSGLAFGPAELDHTETEAAQKQSESKNTTYGAIKGFKISTPKQGSGAPSSINQHSSSAQEKNYLGAASSVARRVTSEQSRPILSDTRFSSSKAAPVLIDTADLAAGPKALKASSSTTHKRPASELDSTPVSMDRDKKARTRTRDDVGTAPPEMEYNEALRILNGYAPVPLPPANKMMATAEEHRGAVEAMRGFINFSESGVRQRHPEFQKAFEDLANVLYNVASGYATEKQAIESEQAELYQLETLVESQKAKIAKMKQGLNTRADFMNALAKSLKTQEETQPLRQAVIRCASLVPLISPYQPHVMNNFVAILKQQWADLGGDLSYNTAAVPGFKLMQEDQKRVEQALERDEQSDEEAVTTAVNEDLDDDLREFREDSLNSQTSESEGDKSDDGADE